MRNHRLAALAAAAAMAVASALAVASPAHAANAIVELQSTYDPSFCLQPGGLPVGGSSGLGEGIVPGSCDGSLTTQWTVTPVSSGFHLVNRSSGLCLDARGGAVNYTPVEQWTCDWISNENWSWGNGQQLVSGVSRTFNHCVTIPYAFAFSSYLQSCNGQASQGWYHRSP